MIVTTLSIFCDGTDCAEWFGQSTEENRAELRKRARGGGWATDVPASLGELMPLPVGESA